MKLYKGFAAFYTEGPYTFSERMVERLPMIFKEFKIAPRTLCDMACGDGRFAVAMAKKGMIVTGVDASATMLKYARQRARAAQVNVRFIRLSMQKLHLVPRFDLVTCWFDSMNYLLTNRDLYKVFKNVYHILSPGGFFIFDMNTLYGLQIVWQENSPCVVQNTDNLLEIHITLPETKNNITPLRIIGFFRQVNVWHKMEEIHNERAYKLQVIRKYFRKAGFCERAAWGNLKRMTRPTKTTGKVWFVLQKR
jgi:SAM-dependent methyltransferase